MAGKFSFSPSDFQEAAIKYRKELLYLPIIGCNDTLQYMTARPGIRYKERVGNITGDAQFAPYNPARSKDFDLHLSFREIETYFGSVVAKFEPNSAISTLLGKPKGRFFRSAFSYLIEKQTYTTHLKCRKCTKAE